MENNYLVQAREAYKNDDFKQAQTYYSLAYKEDPRNAEARYFAAFLDLVNANAVAMYDKTVAYTETVKVMLKGLSGDEKEELLMIAIRSSASVTRYVHKVMWEHSNEIKTNQELLNKYNKERNACEKMCIEMIYMLGDAAAASDNDEVKAMSVEAWKNAIAAQQLYPYCGAEKTLPTQYAEKVKAIDPSYVLPKKTGCISFG